MNAIEGFGTTSRQNSKKRGRVPNILMNIIKENQDIIIIEKSSKAGSMGCGLVLLAIALGILAVIVLGISGFIKTKESRWIFLIYTPFLLGLYLASKRFITGPNLHKIIIDRKQQTFTEIWGALKKQNSEVVRRFRDLSKVKLFKKESLPSDSVSPTYYAVEIEFNDTGGSGASNTVELDSHTEYFEALRSAKKIAQFCQLPLEDSSSGHDVVLRRPEELDMPLKDRVDSRKLSVRSPDIPPDLECHIVKDGETVIIEFPKYKMKMGCAVPLFFILGWIASWTIVFTLGLLGKVGMPPEALIYYLLGTGMMALVPLSITIFLIVLIKERRQRLIVTPQVVKHEKYRITRTKVVTLPFDKIEEVVLEPSTLMNPVAIVLRSDKVEIAIRDSGVSDKEGLFIRNFIRTLFEVR